MQQKRCVTPPGSTPLRHDVTSRRRGEGALRKAQCCSTTVVELRAIAALVLVTVQAGVGLVK